MNRSTFRTNALLLSLVATLLLAPANSLAFQREYLTPREVEYVRDSQQLDKRVGVFIKAAERRLLIITDPQAAAKEAAKEASKKEQKRDFEEEMSYSEFSDAVTGTRAQLLSDIANILDEAITNVDDSAIHSEKSGLIPKAVRKLAEACTRMLPRLEAMRAGVADEGERAQLELAIENAQQIVEAVKKVPAEELKQEKEKEKKKAEKKN